MNAKTAVITGANRGIGYELVRQLIAENWRVYLGARDLAKAQQAARHIPGAIPLAIDIDSQVSMEQAARTVADHGPLHLLVNNAGVKLDDGFNALNVPMDLVLKTFSTNTAGSWYASQVFAPLLIQSKGSQILNIASSYGQLKTMGPEVPAYRVSKTALNAVTCLLHNELNPKGVRVNSLCPGWVRTDMGGASALLDVKDSVRDIVQLLLEGQASGQFFQHGKQLEW
jgi:NAD(P)-dependent dehydrogenase (short-subunit alcohol dehydrogenase family)